MNSIENLGKVLIIAAHADDETLGCGGLISKLKSQKMDCHIHVATGSGKKNHPIFNKNEFKQIREEFLNALNHLGLPSYTFGDLPAAMLNDMPIYQINQDLKMIIEKSNPNTIFFPSYSDLHLDHKIINYAVKVASRPYLKSNKNLIGLFEYEVPSETNIYSENASEIFTPNFFIDISSQIDLKLRALSEYKSQIQLDNQPRTLEVLKSLAVYRGSNIGVKFAEAFKIVFAKLG